MMELKPCPFCGGEGSLTIDIKDKIIFASCWDCGVRGLAIKFENNPLEKNLNAAIEAWNRRAHPSRWIRAQDEICYWYECMECHARTPYNSDRREWYSNYCPNCGAEMEETDEN